jgi:hypothetical protein
LRKGYVVSALQAVTGALGLVRADGAADGCAADPAKGRRMTIARRRTEGEAQRRSAGSSAKRAVIGLLSHAGDWLLAYWPYH